MNSRAAPSNWVRSPHRSAPGSRQPRVVHVIDLEHITGFHVHRGILASSNRRPLLAAPRCWPPRNRVVVLEGLNNHTNLGALFRSAAGLGMDAVLLSPKLCRPAFYPPECAGPAWARSSRLTVCPTSSLGRRPWAAACGRILLAGLTLAPGAVEIQTLPAELRRRPALLLGAEGTGLSPAAQTACDAKRDHPDVRRRRLAQRGRGRAVAFWELSRH